jgi:radical SAM protein with 4Fe4S-binding SPASM domain
MTPNVHEDRYGHLRSMAPLLVQVELTEACNLSCRFCYNSQNPRFNKKASEMLSRLAAQGVMQVTLTGGEPLCHPDFFAILRLACDLFPNVMILSNGTLMAEEVVARIHDFNVLSVSVSIHGNRAMHDHLTRLPGSYDRSVAALRSFLVRRRIPVASNFVLNSANLPDLGPTIRELGEIGLQFMTITRFIPVGVGRTAADLLPSRRQIVSAFRTIQEHIQQHRPPHIEVAEAIPFCALPRSLRHLANTCSYGYDRFYVDVDGNLMVCGLSRIPLGGNILRSSLCDILSNSDVRRRFLNDSHVPDLCTVCADFRNCHGGCRAAAIRDGGWCGGADYLMPRPETSRRIRRNP